jgi:hypothetical protein
MLRPMTEGRWFGDGSAPAPGAELFRSRRGFRVWEQTVSHGQLLLRAVDTDRPTRVDLLFKPVRAMRLRAGYDGLAVRCATEDEAAAVGRELPGLDLAGDRVFVLDSGPARDFVVAGTFGWHEDDRVDLVPSALSPAVYPYAPPWRREALAFGARELSGNAASLDDLAAALTSDDPRTPPADRYRYVHVVMTRIGVTPDSSEVHPVGVYLTRAEADEALRAEEAAIAEAVARAAEPGADAQARAMASSAARQGVEKWVETVPVQI